MPGHAYWTLLVAEGLLALLTCVLWSPQSVAPIITIVFMAECGLALSGARWSA